MYTCSPRLACEQLVSKALTEMLYRLTVSYGIGNFETFKFMDDQFNLKFVWHGEEYFIGFKCTALDTDGNRMSSEEIVQDVAKLNKIVMRSLIMFSNGTKELQEVFDNVNAKTLLAFVEYLDGTDISERLVNALYNVFVGKVGE